MHSSVQNVIMCVTYRLSRSHCGSTLPGSVLCDHYALRGLHTHPHPFRQALCCWHGEGWECSNQRVNILTGIHLHTWDMSWHRKQCVFCHRCWHILAVAKNMSERAQERTAYKQFTTRLNWRWHIACNASWLYVYPGMAMGMWLWMALLCIKFIEICGLSTSHLNTKNQKVERCRISNAMHVCMASNCKYDDMRIDACKLWS